MQRTTYLSASTFLVVVTLSAVAHAQSPPRVFARGVVTSIAPELKPEETFSVHDMIEITAQSDLEWKPETLPITSTIYSQAHDVHFSHEVWGLEFAFKPLRMIEVDLPQPGGGVERKRLWYLVYRIKNNGARLRPVENEAGEFTAAKAEPKPVEFVPQFVLEGQDLDASGEKIYKAYLDRLIPSVVETIRRREVPSQRLLNSVEIASTPIEVSTDGDDQGVWGVAIWEDIDPEMDFLSIYVKGLTNAYRWADSPGEFKPGDPVGKGRRLVSKTLQLNFWRPGDEFLESEEEIRYGVPDGKADLYDVEEGVAYRWTYR